MLACVNGKGDVVVQTYALSGFTKIDHGTKGDIIIVKDDHQYVEVSSQQNIIDILKVEVDGSTLKIRTENAKSIGKYEELKFYVHMPVVEDIQIGGAGTVTGGDSLTGDKFTCKVSSNGSIVLTGLHVSYTEIIIAGSGSVKLTGHADKSDMGVGSNGHVECFGLSSDETSVQLKGAGSIETLTNVKLTVLISGNGGVYYKGNPVISSTITGNGVLLQAP